MANPGLPENLAEVFEYLDELRESGITNMFGARPYIAREFDMDPEVAGAALTAWMRSFDRTTSPEDRAFRAVSK